MTKRKPSARTWRIMQEVAAEILTGFMFANGMDEVLKTWKSFYEQYALNDDPYTGCPCSDEEYGENELSYQRDLMFERYGHCDGLD